MTVTKPLVIAGCGAVGIETLCCALDGYGKTEATSESLVKIEVVGYFDSYKPRSSDASFISEKELIFFENIKSIPENTYFVIGVSNPYQRHKLFLSFTEAGLQPMSVIHRTAIVSRASTVGVGCVLCPYTCIGPLATIDQNTFLSNFSSVAHDANIGHSCFLHPYSTVSGFAMCGQLSVLETRSSISASISLGANCSLSAGSVLTTDSPDSIRATGNPAICEAIKL